MKLTNHLDFNQLEGRGFSLEKLPVAPSTPVEGRVYQNTGNHAPYYWNGTAWKCLDATLIGGGIPLSALAVNPVDRTNHTGTQLAASISDFDTQVRTNKLNQLAAPTADVDINGHKLLNVAAPTNALDAANKQYVDNKVDSAAAGIDNKASVRVVATTNQTQSGLPVIDGVTLVAGDRVLLTGQTLASNNGVYIAAAGAWTRATDADATGEITPGGPSGLSKKVLQVLAPNGAVLTPVLLF